MEAIFQLLVVRKKDLIKNPHFEQFLFSVPFSNL